MSDLLKSVSDGLIRVLPPAFVLLIVLNIIFLGVVVWVFQNNSEQRNILLTKIVDQCLLQGKEVR